MIAGLLIPTTQTSGKMSDLTSLFNWGALKLVSGLISVGSSMLMLEAGDDSCDTNEVNLVKWGGDLVYKAKEKSSSTPARETESTQQLQGEIANLATQVGEVQESIKHLREALAVTHEENTQFLHSFNETLHLAHPHYKGYRSAQIALDDFHASEGDVSFLEAARNSAMSALAQGPSLDLDARLIASMIALAAGYVRMSKIKSPEKSKMFTINGTIKAIIQNLAPIWTVEACETTPFGKKTVHFLLDLLSCTCLLPPEETPVLSEVDGRLLPILGWMCATQPTIRVQYPKVAGEVLLLTLNRKRILDLCIMAHNAKIDIDAYETKTEIVNALIHSGNVITNACSAPMHAIETGPEVGVALGSSSSVVNMMSDHHGALVCSNSKTRFDEIDDRGAIEVVRKSGGQETMSMVEGLLSVHQNPSDDVSTTIEDREVISALQNFPGGPSRWKESWNWGSSDPLGTWHGLTTDGSGRVVRIDLRNNFIKGEIPPALGGMTALMHLMLSANGLTGSIPSALGNLVSLVTLDLSKNNLKERLPSELGNLTALVTLSLENNKLQGPIPPELGNLTALKVLMLGKNKLSGSFVPELCKMTALSTLGLGSNGIKGTIPPELGNVTALKILDMSGNNLSGTIPPELGRLTALEVLALHENQLAGYLPKELQQLSSLKFLGLSSNWIKGWKEAKETLFSNCPETYCGFSQKAPPVF